MSSGQGVGGRHTDRVEDKHDGEVVDDSVIERCVTASTWISLGGHTHVETGTLA